MHVLTYPINKIRQDFPILLQKVNNKPLVYLDNSATTQKPLLVIRALEDYYLTKNANVHRGVYTLSEQASVIYENAREAIRNFIKAKSKHEIIFVKGTTEAINLVASSYSALKVKSGDEIIISAMEHHSNIIPWQVVCERYGAKLKIIPISDQGDLEIEEFIKLINKKTKLVAITHISNVLGTINPIKKIVDIAHGENIPVLIDGAQAIAHTQINVQELNCDFYVFSGHKMYASTGFGVLYGKEKFLEQMPPYQTGGGMISQVSFEKTIYRELPEKFEAGTPDVGGAIALHAAIKYLEEMDLIEIEAHEKKLLVYAEKCLSTIPGIKIIGKAKEKAPVISFISDYAHPHDIGTILDSQNIAIRAGHHCAMPLMKRLNVSSTARISFGMYNTKEEIDQLVVGLEKVNEIFAADREYSAQAVKSSSIRRPAACPRDPVRNQISYLDLANKSREDEL